MKNRAQKTKKTGLLPVVALLAAFTACSSNPRPAENTNVRANQPAKTSASFINKVWKVNRSNSVAPGHLYTFLSEGTLVIASPQSKPALGAWTYKDGNLTMTEDSLTYKVDIVKLSEDEFSIRINNPGQIVEITFVPASEAEPAK